MFKENIKHTTTPCYRSTRMHEIVTELQEEIIENEEQWDNQLNYSILAAGIITLFIFMIG